MLDVLTISSTSWRHSKLMVTVGDDSRGCLRLRAAVDVRVVATGQLAAGLLDVLGARAARDTENLVVVARHHGSLQSPGGVPRGLTGVARVRVGLARWAGVARRSVGRAADRDADRTQSPPGVAVAGTDHRHDSAGRDVRR